MQVTKCYPSSKILINVAQVVRIFHVEIPPLFEWNSLFLWTAWTRPDVFANAACQSSAFWWQENITGDPQNDFENLHIINHRENRLFQASRDRIRSFSEPFILYFRPQTKLQGGCMVKGHVRQRRGVGVCVAREACVAGGGVACVAGGSMQERRSLKRAVCILLECILVLWNYYNILTVFFFQLCICFHF